MRKVVVPLREGMRTATDERIENIPTTAIMLLLTRQKYYCACVETGRNLTNFCRNLQFPFRNENVLCRILVSTHAGVSYVQLILLLDFNDSRYGK